MKILKEKSFLSGKVKLRIYDDFFVVESDESLKTYSSAILGGGKKFTRTFIGKKVEKNYISENPEKDLQEIEKKIGAIDSVGMMTACDVKNLFIKIIGKPKTLNILYTLHHNIILVFFVSFQFACNRWIMQGQYLCSQYACIFCSV